MLLKNAIVLEKQSFPPPVQLCPIHTATYWFCIQTEFRPSRAFDRGYFYTVSRFPTSRNATFASFFAAYLVAKVCTFIQWILNSTAE